RVSQQANTDYIFSLTVCLEFQKPGVRPGQVFNEKKSNRSESKDFLGLKSFPLATRRRDIFRVVSNVEIMMKKNENDKYNSLS
ncbi:hypothetical protein BgiMline_001542, partial [Biomphalaria glabrata]